MAKVDHPILAHLRRAYEIHDQRVRRDGEDRCVNCKHDLRDVPSLADCPECGAEN